MAILVYTDVHDCRMFLPDEFSYSYDHLAYDHVLVHRSVGTGWGAMGYISRALLTVLVCCFCNKNVFGMVIE